MTDRLVVLSDGRAMGVLDRSRAGRLTFTYTGEWINTPGAWPLSLSMPLAVAEHGHARIEPWLWGLLPDNEYILRRWSQQFHVSARNVFALLSHVGEDCAGAIQFTRPDRVGVLTSAPDGHIDWLTENDIAERLQLLRRDQAGWRTAGDTGQFSLAGAQPKTALWFDGQRWGVPTGPVPTTHILKPPLDGQSGQCWNEHVCLRLARELGLPAADTRVQKFGGETAIVVTRYDRIREAGRFRRVHQEDFCQLSGLPPTSKYQNEGGPSAEDIAAFIRAYSSNDSADIETFVRALAFNWLIGGTDAHAKNYSLLIGTGGQVRLAPLYDIASAYASDLDPIRLRLAQKIGGRYRIAEIGRHRWERFATAIRIRPEWVVDMCATMAGQLPEALARVLGELPDNDDTGVILRQLSDQLEARARGVHRAMSE